LAYAADQASGNSPATKCGATDGAFHRVIGSPFLRCPYRRFDRMGGIIQLAAEVPLTFSERGV
jgi:hypothetical protein